LGNQMLGVHRGGNWSIHFGVETTKQAFQGNPELPGILDQENAHSAQIRRFTRVRVATTHNGHRKSQRTKAAVLEVQTIAPHFRVSNPRLPRRWPIALCCNRK
jgi:hypothetical protein